MPCSQPKFNTGDKVRRIKESYGGAIVGKTYTVARDWNGSVSLNELPSTTYMSKYFEIVHENPEQPAHYGILPPGYTPYEIAYKLDLDGMEMNILKYLLRHRAKNGAEDIRKLIHTAQELLRLEYGQ